MHTLPITLGELDRTVPNILAVELTDCTSKVCRISEADEAIPFALLCALVPDDLCLLKGSVLVESPGQRRVVHLVPKIAAEEPAII